MCKRIKRERCIMSLDIEFTYKGFRTYYDNLNKDWCCSGLRIRTNSVEQMKSKIDKKPRKRNAKGQYCK